MNQKLLFLGIFLSLFAISFLSLVTVFVSETENNTTLFSNFQLALQVNFFHAIVLFVLASLKRKYTDKGLLSAGYLLLAGTVVFSLPAYVGLLINNEVLFTLLNIFGLIGIFIGWIVITKTFYEIYYPKRH